MRIVTKLMLLLLCLFGLWLPATASAQKIILWPAEKAPEGWLFCDGALISKESYSELFKAVGTTYGEEGDKFALPDLRKSAHAMGPYGHQEKTDPEELLIQYIISDGRNPDRAFGTPLGGVILFAGEFQIRGHTNANGSPLPEEIANLLKPIVGDRYDRDDSTHLPDLRYDPEFDIFDASTTPKKRTNPTPQICLVSGFEKAQFIGEVAVFAGSEPPRGWHRCDSELLPIAANTALFSLVGTTYGGNGRTTFGVPNLIALDASLLKKLTGLEPQAPQLFHAICVVGMYPSRN